VRREAIQAIGMVKDELALIVYTVRGGFTESLREQGKSS